MRTSPLSERSAFRDGVVLSGTCSSVYGSPLCCELGIKKTRAATQLWNWAEGIGGECVATLPVSARWQDWVALIAGHDVLGAPVAPEKVAVRGVPPAIGDALALAWSADEQHQSEALLLSRLSESGLSKLANGQSIRGNAMIRAALRSISQKLARHDLSASDLDQGIELADANPVGVRKTFADAIGSVVRRQRSKSRAEKRRRAPFEKAIAEVVAYWVRGKPGRHYPGGGNLPPRGTAQLQRFLWDFVSEHGALPKGIHVIPAGADIFQTVGDAFEVDFDDLASLMAADGAIRR